MQPMYRMLTAADATADVPVIAANEKRAIPSMVGMALVLFFGLKIGGVKSGLLQWEFDVEGGAFAWLASYS